MRRGKRGAVTVFISIILSAMLLVVGVFSDAARARLAHTQVQRANKSALASVLANYNNALKDEYGLFGLNIGRDDLYDCYEEYLYKNLNIANSKGVNLYDYRIEHIAVDERYNLESKDIFEKQIIEFMKYRAPYEIASDIIKKVEGIKNISKGAELFKRKMDTDKHASELGSSQQLLESKTKAINNSNLSSKLTSLHNEYTSKCNRYEACTQKLSEVQALYSKEKDSIKKIKLQSALNSLNNEINDISDSKQSLKNSIRDNLSQYKELNIEAQKQANAIISKKEELIERVKEEIDYVKNQKDGIKELQSSYENDLMHMKEIVKEDNSAEIKSAFDNNIFNCDKLLNKIDDYDLGGALNEFNNNSINYEYNRSKPISSDDKDNRKDAAYRLERTINKKGEYKKIPGDTAKLLPSRSLPYDEEAKKRKWSDVQFDNADFLTDDLDYIATKEDSFKLLAETITKELYLNEYIMGSFRHDVPYLKGEDEKAGYNLRSMDKFKRDGFFNNYEVEYVINGNRDEEINSLLIKTEIITIRFISNLIHIYTDSAKITQASGLAAALSAWNAGLSTPLMQTMVIASWAMFESLYDMDALLNGGKVLLFKTKEQWKTDISGVLMNNKNTSVENNPLCLSYQDYLKVFLLTMNKDKKVSRTQDIVQLNLGILQQGFMLEHSTVVVKAETQVSMKNWFISLPTTNLFKKKMSRTYFEGEFFMGY